MAQSHDNVGRRLRFASLCAHSHSTRRRRAHTARSAAARPRAQRPRRGRRTSARSARPAAHPRHEYLTRSASVLLSYPPPLVAALQRRKSERLTQSREDRHRAREGCRLNLRRALDARYIAEHFLAPALLRPLESRRFGSLRVQHPLGIILMPTSLARSVATRVVPQWYSTPPATTLRAQSER